MMTLVLIVATVQLALCFERKRVQSHAQDWKALTHLLHVCTLLLLSPRYEHLGMSPVNSMAMLHTTISGIDFNSWPSFYSSSHDPLICSISRSCMWGVRRGGSLAGSGTLILRIVSALPMRTHWASIRLGSTWNGIGILQQ